MKPSCRNTVLFLATIMFVGHCALAQGTVKGGTELKPLAKPKETVQPKDETDEPAWGEAVDGVQVRLYSERTVWTLGEVPSFKADIRNRSLHDMTVAPIQDNCELEFDGRWYLWSGAGGYVPKPLPQNGQFEGVVVSLLDIWCQKSPGQSRAEVMRRGQPLELAPGTYIVRLACKPEYAVTEGLRVIRALSNPIKIEILPSNPYGWGVTVEGLQCRLQAEKSVWNVGDVPMVLADIRNVGDRDFLLTPIQVEHRLEFDGSWCRWGEPIEQGIRMLPLSPGQRVTGVRFSLDNRWILGKDRKPLNPAFGKHTVRVALTVEQAHAPQRKRIRITSNPVVVAIGVK